ncbi:MAG: hypothetical protein ACE5PM_00990 [Candidatus Hydrothermarchaeales archaeon]
MRRLYAVLILLAIVLSVGCTIGSTQNLKLTSEVVPSKISLDNPEAMQLEATIRNVGTSTETITIDVIKTEGVDVEKPERTEFTLKPGESRMVTFGSTLASDAVPGDYVLEVYVQSRSGEYVGDRAKLRVVKSKGLF